MDFELEYRRLAHAIQSATAFEIAKVGEAGAASNGKHLRTGLNLVMTDHASLAGLLMKKGIITPAEYEAALLEGLQQELERVTQRIRRDFNMPGVSFG